MVMTGPFKVMSGHTRQWYLNQERVIHLFTGFDASQRESIAVKVRFITYTHIFSKRISQLMICRSKNAQIVLAPELIGFRNFIHSEFDCLSR